MQYTNNKLIGCDIVAFFELIYPKLFQNALSKETNEMKLMFYSEIMENQRFHPEVCKM